VHFQIITQSVRNFPGTRFRHDNLLARCIRATIFGKIDRLQFSLLRVRLVNRKIHWRRMLGYSIRLM
jgi:hypothetical protein